MEDQDEPKFSRGQRLLLLSLGAVVSWLVFVLVYAAIHIRCQMIWY